MSLDIWNNRSLNRDGCESHWTLGVGDGQGGLACCDSWGRKESDSTERLIWSDLRASLQNTWPAFLQTVKVIKNKKCLRNCHSPEEPKGTCWLMWCCDGQDPEVPCWDRAPHPRPAHVLCLPLVCRKTSASEPFPEFQRIHLIREVRKCGNKNSQARQSNNSLAIKQSQVSSSFSRAVMLFWAMSLSCLADTETTETPDQLESEDYVDFRLSYH